jgi:probable HAF family extracellular repeat protein
MRPLLGIPLCAALALPLAAAGQNAPAFYGLGDLSGGDVGSAATAVSTDASTVVGHAEGSSGTQAVRWTEAGGLQGLGQPAASEPFSRANGVSANGAVIVGTAATNNGGRAFRWTSGGGYVFLGTFGCFLCDGAATGEGVSGNGLVAVGSGLEVPFLGSPRVNAARWTGGGTSISDLGDLPGGGDAGTAQDATTTGSVIVGETDATAGPTGFWWNGSMHGLPGLPGAVYRTGALAISDDGSTIVGEANSHPTSTNNPVPVRWTGGSYATIQGLGSLPGQSNARGEARDVSPNGSLVVGTTRDLAGDDVAFLWDAANGMRSLAQVLEEEYGLALGGWQLHAANGISQVNAFGEFTVVGEGTNPAGEPEGFVAILSPTDCNDGVDGDGDLLVDFPADPQCTSLGDRSEGPDCSDGLDNDGDGQTDFPADAACTSASDLSELPDCSNGFDDDGDGDVDHPADDGCRTPGSQSEAPACDDGVDNDGDLAVDLADSGCLAPSDNSERLDCNDAADNDGDGLFDFPADPDCTSATDPAEDPACSDFVDNDADGRTDYPAAYPRCRSQADTREAPECSDGVDVDGDLGVDFPGDSDCPGPLYDVEAPAQVSVGDLLVVDRGQAKLFALDPVTGAEQVVSQGAQLVAPEGLAQRADGRLVISSPSGLFETHLATGRQALRSGPFVSTDGMPVAVDSAGNLIVHDAAGMHRVAWNPAGTGATTTLLTAPVGGNPGQLQFFTGFTLALQDDDTVYTTGFGLLGDGVFRAELAPPSVSKVTPGFLGHSWRDLALETAGTLVAVGLHAALGEGVYRIDTSSGAVTALSTGAAWIHPEGVAVGAGGDLYVADSGTCGSGSCSGGLVARVDPVSGTRSVVRSGIFGGALQIAVVESLPGACADGIDSDGDGLVDLGDPGCANASDASERDFTRACDNGLDDDSDGLYDYPFDPACWDPTAPIENPQCDNDFDDDADGKIDWDGGSGGGTPDPQCPKPWGAREKSGCGLGFELMLVLPLLARLRRRR